MVSYGRYRIILGFSPSKKFLREVTNVYQDMGGRVDRVTIFLCIFAVFGPDYSRQSHEFFDHNKKNPPDPVIVTPLSPMREGKIGGLLEKFSVCSQHSFARLSQIIYWFLCFKFLQEIVVVEWRCPRICDLKWITIRLHYSY